MKALKRTPPCRWRLLMGVVVALVGLASTASGAGFERFLWSVQEGRQVFRVDLAGSAALKVHDQIHDRHYFYVDFYDVDAPDPRDRTWNPEGDAVHHVKQLYYAQQRVLRFVFYTRGDAWFSLRTVGPSSHEIVAQSIRYIDLGRAGDAVGGSRKIVVIDPGHGGTARTAKVRFQEGARTSTPIGGKHYYEKDVALQISRRLKALVDKAPNMRGVMTRDEDVYVSLPDRIERANAAGGDVFVSLHLNGSGTRSKTARGFEIYYLSDGTKETNREMVAQENEGVELDSVLSDGETLGELLRTLFNETLGLRQAESRELCEMISREFEQYGPSRRHHRGVKSAPFRVLMNFEMPSALLEIGFLDHPEEARLMIDPRVQQQIAILIFNALNRYFAIQDTEFRPTRVALSP